MIKLTKLQKYLLAYTIGMIVKYMKKADLKNHVTGEVPIILTETEFKELESLLHTLNHVR